MRWNCLTLSLLTLLLVSQTSLIAGETADTTKAKETAVDQAALEKALSEKLSGATLVGTFTITGKTDGNVPKPERYELQSVSKLKTSKDRWVFVAKIQYGKKKATLPLPITVKVLWAGDTPMVSLTNLTIPGLGTFSSRVIFDGDRYAGTWQHGKLADTCSV